VKVVKPSLSTLQSVVALVAGLTSIGGATYSTLGYLHATPPPGELVAVVRDARTDRAVRGAVVEVRSSDDAVVTTLPENNDGFARRAIAPGVYRVHVVHPAFAEATREVHVQPGGVSEVRVPLEPRPGDDAGAGPARVVRRSEPVTAPGRAIDRGVTATRRLLGRLGL
jgi:hypothetical protein